MFCEDMCQLRREQVSLLVRTDVSLDDARCPLRWGQVSVLVRTGVSLDDGRCQLR